MSEEKIRLGGMALSNGVLVHGPKSWACAIRAEDGTIKVAGRRKRFRPDSEQRRHFNQYSFRGFGEFTSG